MTEGSGTVYIIQHVDFEGPGIIPDLLEEAGYPWQIRRVFDGQALPESPELAKSSGLILMGGPMNVDQTETYPWLTQELILVRRAIQEHLPVLGICLGAQIIAASLGAGVQPMEEPEIGWFPVSGYLWGQMEEQQVLHWHGQRFSIASGAINLVQSKACREQAFRLGSKVLGLQFHLEVDRQGLESLISHSQGDLNASGSWMQSPDQIRDGYAKWASSCRDQLGRVLNGLFPVKQGLYTRGWG